MNGKAGTGYFGAAAQAARTLWAGLRLTWRHMRARGRRQPMAASAPGYFGQTGAVVTIQYPQQQIPAPETGRYRLHLETPDCIGCDQCARICPVDCIDIQKIKAVEELPPATDGSKVKFWLPVFDIDMAKCCYCGLCTVVCPTECLTMTPVYDFPERSREAFVYHFGNLDPAGAEEKNRLAAEAEAQKAAARAEALQAAKPQAPASA